RSIWSISSGTKRSCASALPFDCHSCYTRVFGSPQGPTFGHCPRFVVQQALTLSNLRFVRFKPSAVISKVSNLAPIFGAMEQSLPKLIEDAYASAYPGRESSAQRSLEDDP